MTGEQDNIKFAISLKNVGPPMSFSGDGLSLDILNPSTSLSIGMVQRSSSFELPSQLCIGTSYDFIFSENSTLTAAGSFSANSFSRDQFHFGLNWKVKTEKASFGLMGGLFTNKVFSIAMRWLQLFLVHVVGFLLISHLEILAQI